MMNSPVLTGLVRVLLIALSLATLCSSCATAFAGNQQTGDGQTGNGQALNAIFGDEFVAENVVAVRRRARSLETTRSLETIDGYQFLIDWVLPSETHSTIRMQGKFAYTDPSAVSNVSLDGAKSSPTTQPPLKGGSLFCPAIDLIDVARGVGRLNDLRDQVAQLPDSSVEEQRRAKVAMLFLIDLALENTAAAEESAQALTTLVAASTEFNDRQQWPQTVAAWFGLRHPKAWPMVADMVTDMRIRQILEQEASGSAVWFEQLSSMNGLLQHLNSDRGKLEDFTRPPPLRNWIQSSVMTARTHAEGWPKGHWNWNGGRLQNLSSHDQSLLFYRIPLLGNFEISCELPFPSNGELHLMYAGEYVIPHEERLACRIGNVRKERLESLEPRMTEPYGPPWLRINVRDNVCTTWFNGRMVRRRRLSKDHDPWLAVRATSSRLQSTIRSLRIDGIPDAPSEVNLCADESLNGWWSYFGEQIGPDAAWRFADESGGAGLVGNSLPAFAGMYKECLLQYYRPLAEDGSLEFEFDYQANQTHIHPALDGLAFLLEPDGVKIHRVTDGKYEQTEADPAGAAIEPDCRRGSGLLPLKVGTWNRCRLTLRGDTVDLFLNNELIYSKQLETTAQRVFGFFRYADEGEVHVRNVIWRGNWLKGAFDAVDQQLVTREPNPLDATLDGFESFQHNFVTSGLPMELFKIPTGSSVKINATSDGLKHSQTSGGAWTDSSIVPVFRMHGDFDATVAFGDLQVTDPEYGGCAVVVRGEDGRVMMLSRRMRKGNLHRVYLTWRAPVGDGEFRFVKELLITEALAGRFRVARRGDTYFFQIAEYDSPVFRSVGEQTIEGAGQLASQLELRMIASLGATTSANWKNVSIAAEELKMFYFRASDRDVTEKHWAMIADAASLEELSLSTTNIADDDLAKLKHNPDLRLLYLVRTGITSRGVRHLAELKQLENLLLTITATDDEAAATLGGLSQLRTLGLSNTQVGDATIRELSRLSRLEVLGLRSTNVTDKSIASFSKMKSLRTLDLRFTELSEAGVERIRKALPNCTVKH